MESVTSRRRYYAPDDRLSAGYSSASARRGPFVGEVSEPAGPPQRVRLGTAVLIWVAASLVGWAALFGIAALALSAAGFE